MSAFICFGLLATTARANDTTVYTYDALGRVTGVSVTGGPNNGRQTSTGFDPADNRTNYAISGAPTANFSIADASVTEGGTAVVTVTRSGALTAAMTVNYASADGSATAPADYAGASGTLAFAAGEASKTISVPTVDDATYEGAENFKVTLSSPSAGAGIANAGATVTIVDNEVVPQLAISSVSVVEGGTAALTVTRSGLTTSAVSVNYATANGTATAPADFTAASGTVSFLANETSKTINIATVNDTTYEGTERFTVALSAPTGGAVIANGVGTVSLGDNDSAPSFAIGNASATEGGAMTFTVTKTGTAGKNLTVNYQTADASAVAPGDYRATSGTLTFLPADTSKTITVTTFDDSIYEAAETFSVYLSGASSGATISTPTGTGTINDNDAIATLSVSDATVVEGGKANLTVTKAGATGINVTVSYATSHGTAGTSDYNPASGTLTFLPSDTSKVIQIPTTDNVRFGPPKTFNFTLSAPSGATLGKATGIVTIEDNDPPPSFSVGSPIDQDEGKVISFPVSITGAYESSLTVNYATSSGTATSGVDFTPASGTLTFTSPTVVVSVPVQTIQDSDAEPDETFTLTISSPSSGATIANAQATGKIKTDDIPPSDDPKPVIDNAGTDFVRCDEFTINPVANDTSPGGHYPLSLVSVPAGAGYTTFVSGNNVTIFIRASGTRNAQYVVRNSIGQEATGIITWTAASGPICSGGGGTDAVPDDPNGESDQ